MMRSLFSGISGLKGFQGSMDVIGNNISNVNTVGFKASRTTFQSMLLQTMIGAKAPDEGGRGGVNSLQIGLGAQIASVDKMMTQGSFQNTGSKTDLSISGDGFFVLSDGIQKFYSRAGNLSLDEKGNFVQPTTGLKLQGWIASIDAKTGKRYIDTDKPVADLFVTAGMTMAAKATVNMDIAGNLSAQTGIEPVTITVQNPNDTTKTYKVRFTFEKVPPFNTDRLFSGTSITYTWKAEIVDWNASSPNEIPELDSTIGRIELDQFGQIVKFEKYATNALFGMIDTSTGGLTFDSSIIDGDSVRTWFNYSPSGSAAITLAVRDLFDPDQDKIPNKILTGASLKLKASLTATVTTGEYLFTPPPTSAGQTTSIRLHESVSPATGDKLTVSYFTQEDLAATSSKTQYRITGPIVDIVGANDITEVDMVVRLSDGAGNFSTAVLTAGTQYTYDANTGTVTIIDTSALSGSSKIRIEYKTQESFIGDGTRTEFQLSKRMINKPPSLTAILTADAYLDLNFVLKEEYGRMEFRKNYPTTGFFENYTIKYADPSNPTDFDVVNVKVSNATKASVSIPKTGKIKFFDKNDTQNYALGSYIAPKYTTTVQVYDSLGKAYNLSIEFQKISTNKWAWRAIEESGMVVSFVDDKERVYTPNPVDATSIVGGIVEFDSGGTVSAFKAIRQNGQIVEDVSITRIKFDPGVFVDDGAAPPPEEGATAVTVQIDFSELVQFAGAFSAAVSEQDGNAMGVMQNFAINVSGQVIGTFSNGKSEALGQIALAIFNNPGGLQDLGNTLFTVTPNSGVPMIGIADVGGRGTISPGVLEMSNTDLSEEFTGMVIVQRAFQANARTITTSDEILQELVNLKR